MAEPIFYRCNKCGNLVFFLNKTGCTPQCCGEPMQELKAGTTDAATEKHVPVIVREGSKVTCRVGEVAHPMLEKHYIQWVALVQGDEVRFALLKPEQEPVAVFEGVAEGEPVVAYEYCNLHGLWKAEA